MKNASPGSEESPARQSLPYGGPAMAWVDCSEYLPIMEWDLCPAPFLHMRKRYPVPVDADSGRESPL